jgi:MFS family permease
MEATTTLQRLNGMVAGVTQREQRSLVQNARIFASLLFLMDGMAFGTWAALIPSFQQKFRLLPAKLSVVLLGLIGGAMVSMPLAGKLIERWGSPRVASPAAVGFATALLLLVLAPSYATLILAAVVFGVWKGALDVSVNSQAITVGEEMERPIQSSFQGFWSLGSLCAASSLGLLMHRGFSPTTLTIGMVALLLVPAIWSFGRLLPDSARKEELAEGRTSGKSNMLWLLGGLAFLALFSEGVMFDWSAVYIRTVGGVSVALAPMGFAAFALCMAAGRFAGDRLVLKAGPVNTLRISGLFLAGGIGVAAVAHHWLAIALGFALTGFGTANIVPVIYSATGRLERRGTSASIAAVATMGYFGFLSGPPLIGFIAAMAGLPVALSLGIISGSVIAIVGAVVVRRVRTAAVAAEPPGVEKCQ